ncbi:NACHT domain-containing protein [Amycolatopsis sp. A1MSW2902]|uniref:NACHT domain-containing protein n=1 Tax=Amycolatopsis sp. A1MSW2902 TaxID=687413 RepID=UPI00307D7E20
MAHDYHLEELGPRAFEQLAATLAHAAFGPGLDVYGSGRDGGREATFHGRISWDGGMTTWEGYTVVQAKQREHMADPATNLKWLQIQVRSELNSWMARNSGRDGFPDYLLFVTNVRLSATPGGGVDTITKYVLEELDRGHPFDRSDTPRSRGLKDIRIWHRDTLNAIISSNQGVRAAFPALLTIGDIIARVNNLPVTIDPSVIGPILHNHAQSSLKHERWVRFGEAGGLQARQSVDQIVVDLPVRHAENNREQALGEFIKMGDPVLRRSVWNTNKPRHLVITGAAGNGKSTLAKYLTQIYRAHFLDREQLTGTTREIVECTLRSQVRLQLAPPKSRRWPLNVSLPEMANDMGPSGGPTMLRWLSSHISARTSLDLQPAILEKWLKGWPCLLILDGLDEVTAPSLRQRVLDEISEFVELADQIDADLFVIVTTRPTGYTERIMPAEFTQLDLDYLTVNEAVDYGRHITEKRLLDDILIQEQVIDRFERATTSPAIERLIKTPLQVLILTFILENLGELPATRYELFWYYYETVYRREQEKPTSHRTFLRTHRDDVTELHQRVGIILQIQCEGTGETRARLPLLSLRALARARMIEVGHEDDSEADALAEQVVQIATTRLVLLTADEGDTVSFEVRSLQELMAARALVDGDDATIRSNLIATAPSPHWRNTWLFAAGKLFTDSDHRRNLVLSIVETFDRTTNCWPGWLYPIGPELAAHLIDDGLAETKPAALRALVEIALRILHGPIPEEFVTVAKSLSYATRHKTLSTLIRNEMRNAFAGTPVAVNAASLLALASPGAVIVPGQPLPAELRNATRLWTNSPPRGPRTTVGRLLRRALAELRDEPGELLTEAAISECEQLTLLTLPDGSFWPNVVPPTFTHDKLDAAFNDPDATTLFQLCLGNIEPNEWAARSLLARAMSAAKSRKPVSEHLTLPYVRDIMQ